MNFRRGAHEQLELAEVSRLELGAAVRGGKTSWEESSISFAANEMLLRLVSLFTADTGTDFALPVAQHYP